MAAKTKEAWSTDRVYQALANRFAPPAHAVITEVPDATGYGKTRTADALVMSLWPSRGLTLSGVEVKASRSDWVKERDDPSKAEAIARYCDYWYLAVGDPSIVQPGELPETWGLLVPHGESLKVAKEPAKLSPVPIDREFLASLFRVIAIGPAGAIRREFERGRSAGYAEARRSFEASAERTDRGAKDECERLKRAIAEFEQASGVRIDQWNGGPIGRAVKCVLGRGLTEVDRYVQEIGRLANSMAIAHDDAKRSLETARAELVATQPGASS